MLHPQNFFAPRALLIAAALVMTATLAQAQQPKSNPSKSAPPAAAQQTAPAPQPGSPPPPNDITLTEQQIQHVLEAQKDFNAIVAKLPKTESTKPDPKIAAELEDTAKKHGFANYAEYNNVVFTLSDVLTGFDPKTKTYIGPEAVLRQQLAAVQADPKIPAKDKAAIVKEINDALKSPPPAMANKANVDLVTKYYDKIAASLQEE